MNIVRTLKAVAICGVLGLSAAAMADTITITVDGITKYSNSSAVSGTNYAMGSLNVTGFDIGSFNVIGYDFPAEGELGSSGSITSTGAGTLTIAVTYSGFTAPNTTTTLGSSVGYTDIGVSGTSTLAFQSAGGSLTNLTEAMSAVSNLTLENGSNGSGASTASPTNFVQSSPYSLTQYYTWTSTASGEILQPSGTTTAINIPEGGSALAYLLLGIAACFGAMRFGKLGMAAV